MTFDVRLVLPAAVLWITAAVAVGLPSAAGLAAALVWASALCVALMAWILLPLPSRRGRAPRGRVGPLRIPSGSAAVCVGLVAAALALTAVAAREPARAPQSLVVAAEDGSAVEFVVRVDRAPRALASGFGGRPQWTLRGTVVAGSGAGAPVTVRAELTESEARRLPIGSTAAGRARVSPNDPGDITRFTLRAHGLQRVAGPPAWSAWTGNVRDTFAAAAATTPGDGGALLPGLAIGDDSSVEPSLTDAMKASSLTHLTAVSGANCALVTALVFSALALVGLGRRTRILGALVALAAFVVLVTPGASVLRAATMAVIVLIGLARGRPAQGLPALGLAVVVMVVADPWISRDYGFALSVLATAGLLVLAGPLADALSRWLPRALAIALAVPFAAQLACQPVLILLTPTLPLYGVPANLLAAPAAPIATVLGCIACLVLPVAPLLGQFVVWLAWTPSQWIATVARGVSRLPGSALPWVEGVVGVALCAGALIAVFVLVLRRRGPGRGPIGAVAALALLVGLLSYAGALGGTTIGRAAAVPDDWQVAACDVGQGDALLVRDGHAVAMIDVGRTQEPAAACLEKLGIGRLNLLVLTHFDADHVGGVGAVIGRADDVLVGQTDRESDERVVRQLRQGGARVTQAYAGVEGRLGGLSWKVVWPPAPFPGTPALSGNDGSITVMTDGKGLRSIFLGDLGERVQDGLLASGVVRTVDVVKVAHHGSADQSDRLYATMRARLGLLSVGSRNGYGHPTRAALTMLERDGTAIARTDEQGLLLVSPATDRGGLRVWSERSASPRATPADHATADDGGRPYAGDDRGGTWPHEAAAPRAPDADAQPSRSRSWRGIVCAAPRWCSSPVRRRSSRTERSGCCASSSGQMTRVSRSATSMPPTTHRESCSPSRAPPSSASLGSSVSTLSRNATTRS